MKKFIPFVAFAAFLLVMTPFASASESQVLGIIPLAGWVAIGVAALVFVTGALVSSLIYSGGQCSASPMCSPTYCMDNPQVCKMFRGKQIECCDGSVHIVR